MSPLDLHVSLCSPSPSEVRLRLPALGPGPAVTVKQNSCVSLVSPTPRMRAYRRTQNVWNVPPKTNYNHFWN